MSTANPIVRPSLGFSWVHWVVRAGLLAWAGFWGWFAAAVVIGEARGGERGGIPYAAALIVILAGLLFAAFRWPRLGGALLVAAGVGAAVFFNSAAAQMWLAAPAIVLGALSMLAPVRRA